MNLVTFSRLTLSRMAVWPIRRIRFGSFLKALTSFSSLLTPPGSRPGRHLSMALGTGALRASLVWRLAERGPAGCGPLLGASRMAAARLGTFRSVHRFGSLSLQLLDEQLLGWRCNRNRGCARHRRLGSHHSGETSGATPGILELERSSLSWRGRLKGCCFLSRHLLLWGWQTALRAYGYRLCSLASSVLPGLPMTITASPVTRCVCPTGSIMSNMR